MSPKKSASANFNHFHICTWAFGKHGNMVVYSFKLWFWLLLPPKIRYVWVKITKMSPKRSAAASCDYFQKSAYRSGIIGWSCDMQPMMQLLQHDRRAYRQDTGHFHSCKRHLNSPMSFTYGLSHAKNYYIPVACS